MALHMIKGMPEMYDRCCNIKHIQCESNTRKFDLIKSMIEESDRKLNSVNWSVQPSAVKQKGQAALELLEKTRQDLIQHLKEWKGGAVLDPKSENMGQYCFWEGHRLFDYQMPIVKKLADAANEAMDLYRKEGGRQQPQITSPGAAKMYAADTMLAPPVTPPRPVSDKSVWGVVVISLVVVFAIGIALYLLV